VIFKLILPHSIEKWGKLHNIIYKKIFINTPALVTVVIPFYNQAQNICEVVNSIIRNSEQKIDLILIDDNSSDKGSLALVTFLENSLFDSKGLCSVKIIQTKIQLFETFCEDLGIKMADTKYVIEIQSDMFIQHIGFDTKLVKALTSNSDFIAIGGRGCHDFNEAFRNYADSSGAVISDSPNPNRYLKFIIMNVVDSFRTLFLNYFFRSRDDKNLEIVETLSINQSILFPNSILFETTKCAGRLGSLIFESLEKTAKLQNNIWVSETIMRGPIIFDKSKYLSVGGFNLDSFFLGFDDHHLFLSAFIQKGFRCGYTPIDYLTYPDGGSTRKRRNLRTMLIIYQHLLRISKNRMKIDLPESKPTPRIDNFNI
jgi:GT2 family glycosyltransferase